MTPRKHPDRELKKKAVIELTRRGMMRTEVAKELGISLGFILTALREEGLLNPQKIASGKRGFEKIKVKQVRHGL